MTKWSVVRANKKPELGMRQHCRDNVTMYPGLQMFVFVVATPFRHRDLHIFRFFLVSEDPLRCRVVVFEKLNKLSRAHLWPPGSCRAYLHILWKAGYIVLCCKLCCNRNHEAFHNVETNPRKDKVTHFSVSDPHKFSCGSGSRIPKMSI